MCTGNQSERRHANHGLMVISDNIGRFLTISTE